MLPAAQAAGCLVPYTNIWGDTDHPGQALASAILQTVQPKGVAKFWEG